MNFATRRAKPVLLGSALLAASLAHAQGTKAPAPNASAKTIPPDVAAHNVLSHLPCHYPQAAKEAGLTGTIKVKVLIDEKGRVVSARAVSGPNPLRPAGVQCAELYRYKPFLEGANPVFASTELEIAFPEHGLTPSVRMIYERNRSLAGGLITDGQFDKAADLYQQNLDLIERQSPDSRFELAETASQLGHLRLKQGRREEASALLTKAMSGFDAEGLNTPLAGRTAEELGGLELQEKKMDEAKTMFTRAVSVFFRSKSTATDPRIEKASSTSLAKALFGLASIAYQTGDMTSAARYCEQTITESKSADVSGAEMKQIYTSCASVSRAAGKPDQASELEKQAAAIKDEAAPEKTK